MACSVVASCTRLSCTSRRAASVLAATVCTSSACERQSSLWSASDCDSAFTSDCVCIWDSTSSLTARCMRSVCCCCCCCACSCCARHSLSALFSCRSARSSFRSSDSSVAVSTTAEATSQRKDDSSLSIVLRRRSVAPPSASLVAGACSAAPVSEPLDCCRLSALRERSPASDGRAVGAPAAPGAPSPSLDPFPLRHGSGRRWEPLAVT
mmetsp:Transcript_31513/g.97361  ORF Transcript_31513/g.97361 Transcript_31513/m.97361 type:complete len:209 (-) Transcript_31513:280-906(-)